MQFYGRIDVGQLMSRATVDPQTVQSMIQSMLMELARAPFEILISVGFIIWFAIENHQLPTLAIIFIGMPAFMLPIVGLGKRIRKWSRRTLERNSLVGSRIHEILTCVRVVKAYATEDFENAKYESVNRTLFKTTMRAVRWGLLVAPTVETIGIILICLFLVYCFVAHVTLANVIPMLAPLLLIYKPLKQMANLQVQIETAQASLQRIWSILDVDMVLPEKKDAAPKNSFTDKIVFDDVSFAYDGGPLILNETGAVIALNTWGNKLDSNMNFGVSMEEVVPMLKNNNVVFDAKEVSEQLRKSNIFIPGTRPGEQTAQLFRSIMNRSSPLNVLRISFLANVMIYRV